MPRAGFCSACGANVWLNADGSCEKGHPASCISDPYDVSPPPRVAQAAPATGKAESGVPMWLKVLVGILFLPFTIFYGIYVMWKKNQFTPGGRLALTVVGSLLALGMIGSAFGQNTSTPASDASSPASVSAPAVSAPVEAPQVAAAPASDQQDVATAADEPSPTTPPVVSTPAVKVAPKSAPRAAAKVTIIVYKTRTGHKYHVAGCRYLRSSQIAVTLSEAKAEGLTP